MLNKTKPIELWRIWQEDYDHKDIRRWSCYPIVKREIQIRKSLLAKSFDYEKRELGEKGIKLEKNRYDIEDYIMHEKCIGGNLARRAYPVFEEMLNSSAKTSRFFMLLGHICKMNSFSWQIFTLELYKYTCNCDCGVYFRNVSIDSMVEKLNGFLEVLDNVEHSIEIINNKVKLLASGLVYILLSEYNLNDISKSTWTQLDDIAYGYMNVMSTLPIESNDYEKWEAINTIEKKELPKGINKKYIFKTCFDHTALDMIYDLYYRKKNCYNIDNTFDYAEDALEDVHKYLKSKIKLQKYETSKTAKYAFLQSLIISANKS